MNKIYLEDQHFQGMDFASEALKASEFESCQFTNCSFLNVDLSGLTFSECLFQDCDLSMAVLRGTAFREVKFKNCKLLGLRFDDCNPFSLALTFEGCSLQFASFFRVKIPKTIFKDCKLEAVEFIEADLSYAVFNQCDLNGAIFEHTLLEGANLQTAYNFALDPEINRIQKAHFSTHNIAGLLQKFKILID